MNPVDDNEEILIKNIIANIEQAGVNYCQMNYTFKIDKSGQASVSLSRLNLPQYVILEPGYQSNLINIAFDP